MKLIRKDLSWLLVVAMIMSTLTFVAFADDPVANANVCNGYYSMRISNNGSTHSQLAKFTNCAANTDYVLSVWTKGSKDMRLLVKQSNSSNIQTGTQLVSRKISGSTWGERTNEFNSGDATRLCIMTNNNPWGGAGTAYFDDIKIYEKDNPENVIYSLDFEDGVAWASNDWYALETSEVNMLAGVASPIEDSDVDSEVESDSDSELPADSDSDSDSDSEVPVANDNVFDGLYSTAVYTDGSTEPEGWQIGKYINVLADTDYVVTFWAKGAGQKIFKVQASNDSWSWGTLLGQSYFGGSKWNKFSFEFNSGSATRIVAVIAANRYGGAGTAYIDDITIVEKDNPSVVKANYNFENGSAWADNSTFSLETSAVAQPSPVPVTGATISSVTPARVNFTADLSAADDNSKIIVALYDGNELVGLKTVTKVYSYVNFSSESATHAKVFIWNSTGNAKPIIVNATAAVAE